MGSISSFYNNKAMEEVKIAISKGNAIYTNFYTVKKTETSNDEYQPVGAIIIGINDYDPFTIVTVLRDRNIVQAWHRKILNKALDDLLEIKLTEKIEYIITTKNNKKSNTKVNQGDNSE